MKKTSKSGKNVVLWIVTVFFALTFLVYIPHIASFIALAVAALLAPIQRWQNFLKKYVKGWIKTVAVIVLVILTLITVPTSETTDDGITPETTLSTIVNENTEATQENTIAVDPTTVPMTEPTTEPATEPATDNGRDYVLNTSTMKFHYPSCSSADDIKDANRAEYHGTREELIEKGYDPCGRCHP